MFIGLEHIIVGSAASVIATLIIIQRLFKNKITLMELQKKYEIDMIKVKKREGRKDKQVAAEINTKPPRSILDQVKGLDKNKIQDILSYLQEDQELDLGNGTLEDILSNPIIKKLADQYLNAEKKETSNLLR